MSKMLIAGIDLGKKAGVAFLYKELFLGSSMLKEDKQILSFLTQRREKVLCAIDSPLSKPEGKKLWRACELELHRMGIGCYPSGAKQNENWIKRAIALKNELKKNGIPSIEVYPWAIRKILRIGLNHKKLSFSGRKAIQKDLKRYVKGIPSRILSHHELDAILCAYMGYLYLCGDYKALGNPREGRIVVPL